MIDRFFVTLCTSFVMKCGKPLPYNYDVVVSFNSGLHLDGMYRGLHNYLPTHLDIKVLSFIALELGFFFSVFVLPV